MKSVHNADEAYDNVVSHFGAFDESDYYYYIRIVNSLMPKNWVLQKSVQSKRETRERYVKSITHDMQVFSGFVRFNSHEQLCYAYRHAIVKVNFNDIHHFYIRVSTHFFHAASRLMIGEIGNVFAASPKHSLRQLGHNNIYLFRNFSNFIN